MEKAKMLIIQAVKELKKEECECKKDNLCRRCISIMQLNSIHNFLSED